MIQKAPAKSRTRGVKKTPSNTQIAKKRSEIRSTWTVEERHRRVPTLREDAADLRFQAHLKFLEFLMAHQAR
ncbi:hypothetical protein [Planctomicrobium piriforme]|uniref:Uncharacterized protein n=1 Tax=Planctomicrobium piriforme TaxID=1576369 RepID=A0A1I3C096_9PLAN|nr:hypothetical protein [Planctomicrobium piriforme]SFH67391.1 hypothetical protein SAMN05421753_1022 [Planctomicrobium piriforme]